MSPIYIIDFKLFNSFFKELLLFRSNKNSDFEQKLIILWLCYKYKKDGMQRMQYKY